RRDALFRRALARGDRHADRTPSRHRQDASPSRPAPASRWSRTPRTRMTGPLRFDIDELGPTEGTELDEALEGIAALELVADDVPVRTGMAFSDRVMGALAGEPLPGAAGFLFPLRVRGPFRGFTESVRQAWASIGTGRPAFARAAALAYVLLVAIAGTSLVG